jgi:hypothetical protein
MGCSQREVGVSFGIASCMFGHSAERAAADDNSPERRALDLLMSNLTSAQRRCFADFGYFEVTGGKSGTGYRIYRGTQQNVRELDPAGREVCRWCFYPSGALVPGDVMLAQKTALELFEPDARAIANKFFMPDDHGARRYERSAYEMMQDM